MSLLVASKRKPLEREYEMKIQTFKYILSIAASLALTANSAGAQSDIAYRKQQLRQIENEWKHDKDSVANVQLTSLEEYISAGLARSPSLKASFYEWKSAVQKISKEFSLPDPQFSYTDYIEEVETRVGPQERAYSVRQMFPFPDKLWIRRSKAFKNSEVAYYNFEKSRLELINQIADAYYEFAYLSKAELITKENMKLLQNFESVAQSKYSSGLAKNQDLLKVQVELGKLENELKSLEDLRNPLNTRLTTLLNFPEDTQLPWPKELLEDLMLDGGLNEIDGLIENLRNQNPQLLAMTEKIASAKEQVRLAKREYVPDFAVGVTQVDTGEALNPSLMDSGKDPLTVMVTVNVPIWFNRINAGIEDAMASLESSEQMREGKENELLSRLAMVHYKLRDSRRQSVLYKDALIPKAVQTLNATKSAYESGGMDFLSLIDAQRMLLNFQLAYYRHNANFNQRFYEVRSLIGEIEDGTISKGR